MYASLQALSRFMLLAGSVAAVALASSSAQAQNDPPPGSARLAHLQGNVSIQPNGVDTWGQADSDMPLGPGDRVYTDQQAQGELQAAQVRAYFASNSDLTLTNMNDQGVELGLAQGTADVVSDGFADGMSLFVSTPNGGISAAGRANFRIDIYTDQQSTVITNRPNGGMLELNGAGGFALELAPGQSVQLSGTNPVYSQPLGASDPDGFDHWAGAIETHRFNSVSARYVNQGMAGYDELDASGDWQPESDYGPIWFPHVDAGWAPYHYGHWVNRPFYGWTWVADEPWGAAPFHYGRWAQVSGRWGWIPGPREQRPVWSPAQVVFAGGIQEGGVGVSVWFPLGPGEAYKPWYPCSPQYIDRINITNIHESRVVHVQNTYINVVNVTNVTYVNRTVGVTAMRQDDFANGRSTKAAAVKIDPRQVEHVQPDRPEARASAQPVILHPVARPVAVQPARPVLINHQGQQAPAAPNARPVAVPVKAAPPAPKAIPGRNPIGNPSVGGRPAPVTTGAPTGNSPAPMRGQPQPVAPVQTRPGQPVPAQPTAPATKAVPPPVNAAPGQRPGTLPPPRNTMAPSMRPPQVAPETKPAPPVAEKPAPPTKDDKKDSKNGDNKKGDKKKDDKKTPPQKPE